jgi:hypothetical protein
MGPLIRPAVKEPDHGPRTLYPKIIGDRARSYYLARFAALEERGDFAPSWNWAAFLFGYWWLLHRKMYAYALVFVGIVAALIGIGHASFEILFLPQVMAFRTFFSDDDILLGDLVYTLLGHIAFPLAANSLYFFHVRRKADRLWETCPDSTALESASSRKAGPTKLEPIIVGVLVALILLIGGSVVVPMHLDGEKKRRHMETVSIPLIEALDRYRADNKSYPDDLGKLVPTYMRELPVCNPLSSKPGMAYTVDKDSGEYYLNCGLGMFAKRQYSSQTKGWKTWD